MKFYKKVLLLCILILSGLLSSSSISRADTFTISATDSYLVDGPTFNEELINAMKKVGSDSARCNYITSIDLIDEPFTSEINVAQNGKPIYMRANYLDASNPNFNVTVHTPYKSDSTTQYDTNNLPENSYKIFKYTITEPGNYIMEVNRRLYYGEKLYLSYKDLPDNYFEENNTLKSEDYYVCIKDGYDTYTTISTYYITNENTTTVTFIYYRGNYSLSSDIGFTATITADQKYNIELYTEANNVYLNENSSYMFETCSKITKLNFIENWKSDNVTNLTGTFRSCHELSLDLSNWNIENVTTLKETFWDIKQANITGWNTSNVTDLNHTFYNSDYIIGYKNLDTSNVTNMSNTFGFYGNSSTYSNDIDISNWNTSNVTGMNYMFAYSYAKNDLDISMLNTSKVTNMSDMFSSSNFNSINMKNLDVSEVTTMEYMFSGCNSKSIDISGWNTSSLTKINHLFSDCKATEIIGYQNLDVSKCTSMQYTFHFCYLEEIDISKWNTSNITNMNAAFNGIQIKKLIGFSDIDTSKVTDMSQMFYGCSTLIDVGDLSGVETDNLKTMWQMFYGCSSIESLDFVGWTTPKLNSTKECFYSCTKLKEIKNISSFNVSKVEDFSYMFYNCSSLITEGLDDISNWDISSGIYFNNMFNGCKKLTTLNLSNWNPIKANQFYATFKECTVLTKIDGIENWNTASFINTNECFCNAKALQELDLSNWNMSKITNMESMFYGCSNLTTVGHLNNWNLSNVTSMSSLFYDCTKLNEVGDLSNWKFPKTTNIHYLFYGCKTLESIGDLSNWDISKITSLWGLFQYCNNLSHIGNISSWNVSNVTDTENMFIDCYELTTDEIGDFSSWNIPKLNYLPKFTNCKKLEVIDMSNWNCTQGTNGNDLSYMFSGCTNLKSVDMSGIKVKNVSSMANWFNGCTSLQKLRLPTDIPNLSEYNLAKYPKTMYSIQDMMDNFGTDSYRVYQKDSYINPSAYSTNWLVSDYSYTLTYKDTEENELGTQTIDVANGPVTLQGVDDIPENKRMFGWAYTKSDAENGIVNLKTGVIAPNGIFPGIQGLDTATLDDDILVLYAVIGDPLSSTLMKGEDFNEALKGLVGIDSAYNEDTRIYNIKWTTEDISSDTNAIHVEQDGETTPVYAKLGTETRTITTTEMVSKTRNHTEYLHSDNVNNSGTRTGNYPSSTSNSMRTITKSVTIPNVDSITVTLKYGFDAGNNASSSWFSSYPAQSQTDYITVGPTNSTTSYTKKISRSSNDSSTWSTNKTKTTTITVPGNTVYINLVTDKAYSYSSWGRTYTDTDGYGFYATLTGVENYEEEEEVSHDETVEVVELYTEAELVYFNENSSEMFYDFTKLDTLDFINTKVSTINTTDMNYMFNKCNLKNIDLTKFNTSNVTDFSNMFLYVYGLDTIDISSWDMSKAEDVTDIFDFSTANKIILPPLPSSLDTSVVFSGSSGHDKVYNALLDDNLDGISDDNIKYSDDGVSVKRDNLSHTYVFGNEIELSLEEGKFISTDNNTRFLYIDYTKNPIIDLTDIQNDIECEEYNFSHFTDSDETLNIKDSLDTSLLDFGEFTFITLYGKFSEKTFKIVYHINNPNSVTDYNTDTYEDTTEYVVSESSETLKDNMFTKPGYKFNKWKREDNTLFEENDSLKDICKWDGSVHDTVNMYADWTPIKYTIYIHSNDILDSNNLPIADSVVKTLEVNYDYNAYNELQVLINELIFEGYTDDSNEDCHIICEVDEIDTDNFTIVNGRTNMADNRKLNGNHIYKEISLTNIYRSYVLNLSKIDGAELHFYCINSLNKVKSRNGDVNKIVQKMIGNKGEYFAYYTAIYYGDSRVYFKPNNLYGVFDLDSF